MLECFPTCKLPPGFHQVGLYSDVSARAQHDIAVQHEWSCLHATLAWNSGNRANLLTLARPVLTLLLAVFWVQGVSEAYLAPSLKLAQEHLQPLLEEAADVQRRLATLGC